MFSWLRRRLTFANVAMVLALVFAMCGGAFAAGKYLITSTKQIKPSVLASLKGKNGANGAPGAQGPAGPQGSAGGAGKEGAVGKEGPAGKEGVAGLQGTTGKTGAPGAPGAPGSQGPTGSAGPAGPAGPTGNTGPEGVCSTTNCILPSGATEKGTWSANISGLGEEGAEPEFAISFPIPLPAISEKGYRCNKAETKAKAGECENVVSLKVEPGSGCTGSVEEPTAPAGKFCIYTQQETLEHAVFKFVGSPGGEILDSKTGTVLHYRAVSGAETRLVIEADGAYAVTAK